MEFGIPSRKLVVSSISVFFCLLFFFICLALFWNRTHVVDAYFPLFVVFIQPALEVMEFGNVHVG